LVALGAFLFAWWIIPTTVKSFLKVSFSEFQAPAWVATSYLDELENFWGRRTHSKVELIEAGREVARAKSLYQFNSQRKEALENEIQRLEAVLNLPSRLEFRYEVARVVRRDLNAWWQQIVIRKGKDFDIPVGAAVVFSGGVVGRVVEVGAFTSRIELITSPNFRMAANVEGDDRPVFYQGLPQTGFGHPRGTVREAPKDVVASSQMPLKLVSTRLGGTFPSGLMLGRVSWLEPGSTGIFQTGEVELDARLLSLHEVAVLIPLYPIDLQTDAP
jgi:rod shape-determining protein MreC